MKRKKVLIAVILCFLSGNICQGRVELNFSDILFFCMAFRDISGQSRVPEIPRAFCALTSETRKQWRIEARIRLQYSNTGFGHATDCCFKRFTPKKFSRLWRKKMPKWIAFLAGVVVRIIFCPLILSFCPTYSKRKVAFRSRSLMKSYCTVMLKKLLAKKASKRGRAQIFLQGNDSFKFTIYGVGFTMVQMIFLANYLRHKVSLWLELNSEP